MEPLSWSGVPSEMLLAIPVDQELDHYRLLAYLQRIEVRYREHKLYPHLEELRIRSEQLQQLQRRKEELSQVMAREVTGFDPRTGEVLRSPHREDGPLRVVDNMIATALPEMRNALDRGSELRQRLASHIRFEPVGLIPLHTREGYLLIHHGRQARVYAYVLPLPAALPDRDAHHGVRTRFVSDFTLGFACTYERIKAELVNIDPCLPVPAMFAFTSDLSLPAIETFVPLAKQLVYEVITGSKR